MSWDRHAPSQILKTFAPSVLLILAACTSTPSGGNLRHREVFFVGGQYVGDPGKEFMQGQMYVERLTPAQKTKPYPIVMIHGAAQTAVNWMGTPDGRTGWADYFLGKGYEVYLVDQPARGRSAWHPDLNGKLRMFSARQIETQFTASAQLGSWPQAKAHTQWPGSGRQGDPIFDAFYASQVESLQSDVETQNLTQAAGAALLDKIGPAILLTHSQAGLLGWAIGEARPDRVKAIIALEPSGPPFHNVSPGNPKARAFGLTDIPLTYDPPLEKGESLRVEQEKQSAGEGLIACTLQQAPARQLVHFQGIPVMILVGEASYHAPYDHCTAAYLAQAGVKTDFVRLEEVGVRGNGHMSMLEKNNLQVADVIMKWVSEKITNTQ